MIKLAKAVYDAQNIVMGRMPMDNSYEHQAMRRILFRLDQKMYEMLPGFSHKPVDPGSSLEKIVVESRQFDAWLFMEDYWKEDPQ